MEMTEMISTTEPWRRWQDWVTTAAGVFLALSPIWFDAGSDGIWAMVLIGAATAVFGLTALHAPGMLADEIMAIGAGVVALLAPWAFSYTTYDAASWTTWVVGAIVIGTAALALPAARAADQQLAHR
jgi:hypothetical protein